jgi:hypothetical protein
VQLAGGTNRYTVAKLKAMGLLKRAGGAGGDEGAGGAITSSFPSSSPSIAGVAYGSYARVLLSPILEQLENKEVSNTNVKANLRLEEDDVLLWQAVELAHSLVSQIKSQQER